MASASAGRERRRRAGGARGQEPSRVVGYDADGAGKEEDGDAGFFFARADTRGERIQPTGKQNIVVFRW